MPAPPPLTSPLSPSPKVHPQPPPSLPQASWGPDLCLPMWVPVLVASWASHLPSSSPQSTLHTVAKGSYTSLQPPPSSSCSKVYHGSPVPLGQTPTSFKWLTMLCEIQPLRTFLGSFLLEPSTRTVNVLHFHTSSSLHLAVLSVSSLFS